MRSTVSRAGRPTFRWASGSTACSTHRYGHCCGSPRKNTKMPAWPGPSANGRPSDRASIFIKETTMRLTGYAAIEFAEKHNLRLSKRGDRINESAGRLTVPEAEAIAGEDEGLIYLDIPDADYYDAPPTSYQPDR